MFDNSNTRIESAVEKFSALSYDFLGNGDKGRSEEGAAADSRWSLGTHTTADQDTQDQLDEMVTELDIGIDKSLRDTLEEAAQIAGSSSLSGFECSVCGLHHNHSDKKHDIRDDLTNSGYNVVPAFAEQMVFSPFCHCGVNELAMLVDFYGYINVGVFCDEMMEFPAVNNYHGETLQAIVRECDKLDGSNRGVMRKAVNNAGLMAGTAELSDLWTFYQRRKEIKDAANNAPVPSHVRTRIEKRRKEIGESVL